MADRFYLAAYRNAPDRKPVFQDLGEVVTIAGMVFQGMGETLVVMSPGHGIDPDQIIVATPDVDEWGRIIRQTDDPEIFVGEVGGINKVIHRKNRWVISGQVQQRVWAKDNFRCVYCGAKMGERLMTIDHFVPLELGGLNEETNYLTACRPCNKNKGVLMPKEFCDLYHYNYELIANYLNTRL